MASYYHEEELLPLSGIQHFAFCERQWALIHVERAWVENVRTIEGKQLHEQVDDPYYTEVRKNTKVVRSVPLVSNTLGLYGVADAIEYIKETDGTLDINIIEYKRGKPKSRDHDEVQLCAQAICLEEMRKVTISHGFFYYGEIRRRLRLEFTDQLRQKVRDLSFQMHYLFDKGITPAAKKTKKCKQCSMLSICVPGITTRNKAGNYIKKILQEMAGEIQD